MVILLGYFSSECLLNFTILLKDFYFELKICCDFDSGSYVKFLLTLMLKVNTYFCCNILALNENKRKVSIAKRCSLKNAKK